MRTAPAFVTAVALLTAPVAANAQDRGAEVIERAAERYEDVQRLCADFVQILEVPLLGQSNTGSGRVCQGQPNLFAMRFADPEGDLVVADGEYVWVYFPSSNPMQVARAPADRSAGGEDFHREFLVEPEVKYSISYIEEGEVAGVGVDVLRLVPLERDKYRSVTLWIEQGEPVLRRVRIEEDSGSVRTLTLSNVVFDAETPVGFFTFTPPAGASIISG